MNALDEVVATKREINTNKAIVTAGAQLEPTMPFAEARSRGLHS